MAELGRLVVAGDWRNATEPKPTGTNNLFAVEIISGLVDLIPRVPLGTQIFLPGYRVQGNNEVHRLGYVGDPTSGSFKVDFGGTGNLTAAIPWNATLAQLRTAIENTTKFVPADLSITGSSAVDWLIEYKGAFANQDMPLPTVDDALLVGGTCEIVTETPGRPELFRDTAFVLDPVFEARIWEGQLSTINVADTLDVTVPAATPELLASLAQQGLGDKLIYDVRFRKVTYAQGERTIQPFAVVATPPGPTLRLSSPTLVRLPYAPLEATLRADMLP